MCKFRRNGGVACKPRRRECLVPGVHVAGNVHLPISRKIFFNRTLHSTNVCMHDNGLAANSLTLCINWHPKQVTDSLAAASAGLDAAVDLIWPVTEAALFSQNTAWRRCRWHVPDAACRVGSSGKCLNCT